MKVQRNKLGARILVLSSLSVLAAATALAQGPRDEGDVWVSEPVEPVLSEKTLLDLAPMLLGNPVELIQEVNPRRIINPDALTRPVPHFEPRRDPLLDLQLAVAKKADRMFATPDVSFEGQGFSGRYPPDTVGAVGPEHYVQMINAPGGTSVQVYDKSTGAAVLGAPILLSSLAPLDNPCRDMAAGDPIPLFDQLAGRWLLTEFVKEFLDESLCVYVSSGTDPTTSTWMLYQFPFFEIPDYPKYAVWPDAYYVGVNAKTDSGELAVYALDRVNMLAGAKASLLLLERSASLLPGFGFQILVPVDLDGATPPPAGSPGIFIRHRDDEVHDPSPTAGSDELEIFEFRADFTTPANSTFTGPFKIPVAEFESELCGLTNQECFAQPITDQKLDPLREPVMHRPVYRNFGAHQTIAGNFVTDVDGGDADRGGIRWFELRRAAGTASGGWSLFQEGTVSAADGLSRWMGSIAMDQAGNMALGYSSSGPGDDQFPSIRYTGRQAGDATGTMPQVETAIVLGGDSQEASRWGDYSAMTVDPVDDCTFWYTNEYVPAGNRNRWATRIAKFSFSSCAGPVSLLTVSKTGVGSGTVTSTPAGIDCGNDCSQSYSAATVVSLQATPAVGSAFAGWSDACTGAGACILTMTSDKSVTAAFEPAGDTCDGIICLHGNRFQVDVEWRDFQGQTGLAQAVPEVRSDTSGVLYFFSDNNWEMLIKVLDGCRHNRHYWVFAAASTNVGYTLTVTDTENEGEVRKYVNPVGRASSAITDTSAFATCP